MIFSGNHRTVSDMMFKNTEIIIHNMIFNITGHYQTERAGWMKK